MSKEVLRIAPASGAAELVRMDGCRKPLGFTEIAFTEIGFA